MARGTRLDLEIGARFEAGWQEVETAKETVAAEILEPSKHRLVFKKEKRRGKTVTLAGPFQLEAADAASVLARFKKQLGCGGTFKEGWMEFQGDVEVKLRPLLDAEGFALKSRR